MTSLENRSNLRVQNSSMSSFLHNPVNLLLDQLSDLRIGDPITASCLYALSPPGKLVRPCIMFAAAEASGGDPAMCVPAAAGLEFCHVASLVHDDVIDQDQVRRGRPSVPAVYGEEDAIVIGDALLFQSFAWTSQSIVAGIPPDRVSRAVADFASAGTALCEGQALERKIVQECNTSLDEYKRMVRGKTSSLLQLACRVGAGLSGAPWQVTGDLASFGVNFGVAFQMQDDMLPFRGAGIHSGKNPLSDIRNGRLTLPMLLAIDFHRGRNKEFLIEAQREASRGGPINTQRVFDLVSHPTVISAAESLISEQTSAALDNLSSYRETDGGRFLKELVEKSTCRTQ